MRGCDRTVRFGKEGGGMDGKYKQSRGFSAGTGRPHVRSPHPEVRTGLPKSETGRSQVRTTLQEVRTRRPKSDLAAAECERGFPNPEWALFTGESLGLRSECGVQNPNAPTSGPNGATLSPTARTLSPNAPTLSPTATTLSANATTLSVHATTLSVHATTFWRIERR